MFKQIIISVTFILSSIFGLGQTILFQDFEGGLDDWSYTLNPTSYTASGDIWEIKTSLNSISPSSGTHFWGMQDLNNPNGGGNFEHTLTFNTVNVSAHTGVIISFDYHTKGYDGTDYLKYEIFEDGSGQGAVLLGKNTGSMTSIVYNVPNTVNSVYLVLIAKQNGGSDYAGWDNVNISGIPTGGGTPQTVTFDGNGNDGGSMSNQTASTSTALTANAYTQTGCTFTEWNTASDGSGTSYADGANYDFSADITLFAIWNCSPPSPHTVTFDGNDNDGGSMSNQTASSSTALTTNAFTQTTCTFTEWNTTPDGSGTSYADGATYDFSADITLFAIWNCPSSCSSIISDNFNGTLSQWSNTLDWTVSTNELKHNLSGIESTSYTFSDLGSQNLTSTDYEWSLCIRNGNWDPSTGNYFGYYLISDNSFFLGSPTGYAVGVNLSGSSDLITLYKVDAGSYTAIITSTYNWGNNDDVCIRVTRTSAGVWQLFYNSGSGETSAGTQSDTDHTSGQYTGGLFIFSSTRAGKLWFDDINICGPASSLPITLLSFRGQSQTNGTNLLDWTTSSEINNDFFTIERSLNGINYEDIGEVYGAGNSNNLIHYNFIDNTPNSGINYYRIKQTDFNGDYSFSDVIALNNTVNKANIYVSNSILQINYTSETNSRVQIIDAVGRTVYTSNINTNIKINTSEFSTGIYIIKLNSSTGNTSQKVKF